ncbi:MAG: hypothetical protein JST19_22925 [Bacteroidetes bacterium]|nr:hypothetical protein [Bacteroidota bacterium]
MTERDAVQEVQIEDEHRLILQKRQYNTIILTGVGIAVLFHPVIATLIMAKSMNVLLLIWMSTALS